MRRDDEAQLDEADLAPTWLAQFTAWFDDARAAGLHEPEAMVLASVSVGGQPSSRTVLLKGLDERGFVFFTNLGSRKGRELAENPRASLLFPWHPMGRQVIAIGRAVPVTEREADEYFASRPYASRISALASPQSQTISSRAALVRAREQLEARYPSDGDVPRPPHWSGFRLEPETVEFWQRREHRLHDRLRFRRSGGGWTIERLAP